MEERELARLRSLTAAGCVGENNVHVELDHRVDLHVGRDVQVFFYDWRELHADSRHHKRRNALHPRSSVRPIRLDGALTTRDRSEMTPPVLVLLVWSVFLKKSSYLK